MTWPLRSQYLPSSYLKLCRLPLIYMCRPPRKNIHFFSLSCTRNLYLHATNQGAYPWPCYNYDYWSGSRRASILSSGWRCTSLRDMFNMLVYCRQYSAGRDIPPSTWNPSPPNKSAAFDQSLLQTSSSKPFGTCCAWHGGSKIIWPTWIRV